MSAYAMVETELETVQTFEGRNNDNFSSFHLGIIQSTLIMLFSKSFF